MIEYTCAGCGKVLHAEKQWMVKKYCSQECVHKYGEHSRKGTMNFENVGECIYQPESIICNNHDCIDCGWNPVVAKARLNEIKRGLPEKVKSDSSGKVGQWVSCEERLPKDREQVLAFTQTGKVMSLHCKDGKWCTSPNIQVSHWMPMPDAPRR